MRSYFRDFLRLETGQDMVEYSLLLAFMVVISAALVLYNGDAVAGIWGVTTNNLNAANDAAHGS